MKRSFSILKLMLGLLLLLGIVNSAQSQCNVTEGIPFISNGPVQVVVCEGRPVVMSGFSITGSTVGTTKLPMTGPLVFSYFKKVRDGVWPAAYDFVTTQTLAGPFISGALYSPPAPLFLEAQHPAHTGFWRVVVVNSACPDHSVVSQEFTITVQEPFQITHQMPTTKTICEGATDSIEAEVRGTIGFLPNSLMSIIWKNGVPISPAEYVISNNTLQEGKVVIKFNNAANNNRMANNGDVYQFKICYPPGYACSEVGNALFSTTCTLTVKPKARITTQPVLNTNFCTGGSINLTVGTSGNVLGYQWYKGSVSPANAIAGATTANYVKNSATIADTGRYIVVIIGECGNDTSAVARVTAKRATELVSATGGRTLCSGGDVTLTASATGENISYQWYRGGTNAANAINGATSSQIVLLNVTTTENYYVKATGDCGSVTSSAIAVNVNGNTAISNSALEEVAACVGANATMSVTASGTNISYKWQRESPSGSGTFVDIVGAPGTASITISGVAATDNGLYRVVVSGDCGGSVDKQFRVNVQNAPVVTVEQIGNGCLDGNLTLRATASGTPADGQTSLGYQWLLNGTNINGATNPEYRIDTLRGGNSGNYQVRVTGKCGSVLSTVSAVAPNVAPVITTQPQDVAGCSNKDISLSVLASGNNLAYQWQKNGTNIGGANSADYTIVNSRNSDAGIYRVIVSNPCGSVTSNVARVDIGDSVFVRSLPQDQSVCPGSNVSFTINAVGRNLQYSWRKNGVLITGAVSSTLNLSNVGSKDSAVYRVEVTGGCSEKVVFAEVTLSLKPATVSIKTQPVSKAGCAGSAQTFMVEVDGNPNAYTYQWRRNGTPITGATTATLNFPSLSPNDVDSATSTAIYDVIILSPCGASLTSNAVTLTLKSMVSITSGLTNITSCAGEAVDLRVGTVGATKFVWRKDGVVLAGETTAVYTIPALGARTSGTYSVTVSGDCGNDATSQSIVTVGTAPAIVDADKMQDITSCGGTNVSLQSKASGNNLNYVWRKNGNVITGANTSALALNNITAADSGTYIVEIYNGCPTRVYDTVVVNIGGRAEITAQPTDISACIGEQAKLSVSAKGAATYQWRKSGVNIQGATNPDFIIPATSANDTGDYSVVITSLCNGDSITSSVAKIALGSVSFGSDTTSYTFTGVVGDTVTKEIRYVNTGATPVKVTGISYNAGGAFTIIDVRPVLLDSILAPGGEVFVKFQYVVLTGTVRDTISVSIAGNCNQIIKTELVGTEDSSSTRIPGIEIVSVRDTITKKTPTNVVVRYIGDPTNIANSGVTSMTFEISFDANLLTPADTINRALVRYYVDTITGRIMGILPVTVSPVPTMGVITTIPFAMLLGDTNACDLNFVGNVVWTGGNIVVTELRNGKYIGDGYCERGTFRGARAKITLTEPVPNPASGSTTLKITLPESGTATIRVYDMIGKVRLTKNVESVATTGETVETIDVSNLQTGNYMIELQQGENVEHKRLTVVK